MTTARIGLLPALLIAASVAFAGWSVGQGVERFRMADRSVTVKGLAERDVQSDFAVWTLGFRRAGNDFAGVQQSLSEDRNRVVAFLREQGFGEDEIEVRPLQVQDLLAREWAPQEIALRFNGNGQVLVKTARIDAIGKAANGVDPLIQAGIQLDTEQNGLPARAISCAVSTTSSRRYWKTPPATPMSRRPGLPKTRVPTWAS